MHSAAYIWAKTIGYLEERLGAVTVSAWFDDAEPVELNDKNLILYSPSDFRRETILRNCKAYIEEVLRVQFDLRLQLVVWSDPELEKHRQEQASRPAWIHNPHFTFSSFIPGTSNQVPLKAALHAAEHPGDCVYNPLYFYGLPGVGKTHLLYAIANHVCQTRPETRVVYIKGEQFTNELVQSIFRGDTAQFRRKYREADVLLVDDIQFIAGKEATQEEFFHTFNDLFERGKQIVITCDKKPGDMLTLEDRLKGRFGTGVMVKLEAPDPQTRRLIVEARARQLGLPLEEEAMDYIAGKLCDNVRQIEGGLRKLRAYRDLADMTLTLDNIARTIADIRTSETSAVVTADTVVRYVCRYFGVEEEQLQGIHRSKNISQPRQIAMYLVRQLTDMSLPDIGRRFQRDHGTVHHAIKKVEAGLSGGDRGLENILKDIRANIEANT